MRIACCFGRKQPRSLCCSASHHKNHSFQGSSDLTVLKSVSWSTFCRSMILFVFTPNQNHTKFQSCENEIPFSTHLAISNTYWLTFLFPSRKILKYVLAMQTTIVKSSFFPLFQSNSAFLIVDSFGPAHPILHSFEDIHVVIWYKDT